MERNQEINLVLNNPETFRQTIEMIATDPAMMRELMRNVDQFMSNSRPSPGALKESSCTLKPIQFYCSLFI